MEMTRSRVNADIWANKISYSISIPSDAIVFGTSITADVELSPIKKGIRLGKVELRLMETVVKRIQASEVPDIRGDRSKSEESEVAKVDMEFPEHSRLTYEDETVDNPTMADEMYRFQATLPLPKSLNQCRQDVDSHQINVSHRFKLMVNIHNPEGHVSQLVCRLPVKLFISPNLPVDETNEVRGTLNGVSDAEINSAETSLTAPPEYGRHQLDQIFSGIDPAGYITRAPSGSATPAGIYAGSRRGSHDNIASLNGVVDGHVSPPGANSSPGPHNHGSALPSILHSRLADLQERGPSSFQNHPSNLSNHHSPSGGNSPGPHSPLSQSIPNSQPGSYFASIGQSPAHSAALSRRTSDDDHTADIHQADYDVNNLSRVPSYGAAIRHSGAMTPFTEGPPSYLDATSRPPSPQPGALTPAFQIQRPGAAHIRGPPTSAPSGVGSSSLSSAFASLNMTSLQSGGMGSTGSPPGRQIAGRSGSLTEEEARLRMLRART
jgi:hypothetical protein